MAGRSGRALDVAGEPVAKIGGDVYDRWGRYDGSRPDQPVMSAAESGPAMGLAYVVDPARWRQGFGQAVVRAAVQHPEVEDVRLFAARIDADNEASRRCVASTGFLPDVVLLPLAALLVAAAAVSRRRLVSRA